MILAGDRAHRAISVLNDSVANFLSAPFMESNGRFGARRAAAWGRSRSTDKLLADRSGPSVRRGITSARARAWGRAA